MGTLHTRQQQLLRLPSCNGLRGDWLKSPVHCPLDALHCTGGGLFNAWNGEGNYNIL